MKQKNKSTSKSVPGRQPESPFLPQKRTSDSPQLRFQHPEQTEEWLISRAKTDYTYSRSASYSSSVSQSGSLRRLANSYETPIMSRTGQDESDLLPQTPHSTQPGHRYATRSSARRSDRLAGQQHAGQYDNTPARGPAKSIRTRRVNKNATYADSRLHDNGEPYGNINESNVSDHSGAILERSHRGIVTRNNQKNRSLNMYGLDGNESDFSDSDMLSGSTSTTTITTITTTTSTTWLQHQGNLYHKQTGLFPLFMRTVLYILVIIETIVRTVVAKTTSICRSSSSHILSGFSTIRSSLGDFFMWLLSCLWMLSSKVSDACTLFWRSPWFYSFRRAPIATLRNGPQFAQESDVYTTEGDYIETTTTTTTTTILEEERRKRGGGLPFCCLCLPLLLLFMVASSAVTGRYFFLPLLARNETNETKVESPFHPISEQFILLKDRLNHWFIPSHPEDPPDQGGAAAFVGLGVEGCIKCLRQDQLMGWIDSAVQREVAEMRMQLHSQKDQILLLQELEGRQSKEILALQTQLTDLAASNSASTPNRATMDLINSLESELSQFKANLRLVQLKVDSASDQTDTQSPATVNLRKDFTTLSGSLVELKGSLQRLHTKCVADTQLAKASNRQRKGDINSLNANMLTLSQKIAEVQGLELTLVQLKREMETFSQTDSHHSMRLTSVVENINSVEASLTSIRQEMREIELNVTETASHSGTSASHMTALYEEMSVMKQDMTDMKKKHVSYEGSIENLVNKHTAILNAAKVTETDLAELRTAVNQLMSTDINSILERLSQLQARLNGLEKDSSQLQLNLNTFQSSRTVIEGDAAGSVNTEAVELLQANLNKLGSQFASLQTDIASIQLKVTELKTSVSQTTETVGIHSIKLGDLSKSMSALEKSLNGSVVTLPGGDSTAHSLISIRDMTVLKEEMDAVHVAIGKIKNDLASETASGITIVNSEMDSLSSKLQHLEQRLDDVKLEASMASFDGAIKGFTQEQAVLQDDVVKLQFNTDLIKKQTSRANGDTIQLSVLETRLNDLATSIQGLETLGQAAAASVNAGTVSNQNVDWVKGDINALRQTLADINAILFAGDSSSKSSSTVLASIQDKLGSLEVALGQLKDSQDSTNDELRVAIAALQTEMSTLGLALNSLETAQKENSGVGAAGLAGAALGGATLGGATLGGANYDEDLSRLRANISQLQQQYAHLEVDVLNCCKNKTAAAGMPWFFPFVSTGGSGEAAGAAAGGTFDEDRVKSIVLGALDMYNADKIGMVDYALESAGGSVISIRCSETYAHKTALFSLFGIPLWYLSNSPRTVIQPDVHPGNCWAFKGTQGYIVIRLASTIKPTAFSMEHIPKALDPAGAIESAPKNFTVWGLKDEYDQEGYLLGSYVYDRDGTPLQFFPVQNRDSGPVHSVELKIGSNHGKMEYTCLYRFRVHGVLHR